MTGEPTAVGPVAAGTVVSKNFLSFARVLADSFRRRHPRAPLFVLLVDEVDGYFDPATEPFLTLRLEDVGIPDLHRLLFRYSRQQAVVAAKAFLLRHLLERGFERAVYLDADLLVLGDLAPLLAPDRRPAILLTPHLLEPLAEPARIARELNVLLSGVYNGGFLAVSNTAAARRFLAWWQDRLSFHCRHAVAEGMHYDQRWLDLVPAFFEDVGILRDPGCNVAHWNLPERAIQMRPDAVLANGQPVRFFHFSGFNPDEPQVVTKYSRRLMMADVGPAAELFARYGSLLAAAGYHETKHWPYAYDYFDNGVEIPEVAREIFREMAEPFDNPFETAPAGSYFHWLNQPAGGAADSRPTVSRLWEIIYRQRPDVQRVFPDPRGADRDAFLAWTMHFGAAEYGIPAAFLELLP